MTFLLALAVVCFAFGLLVGYLSHGAGKEHRERQAARGLQRLKQQEWTQ